MTVDAWNERRKALEESFFMKRNKELLAKLKQELAKESEKSALATAAGVADDGLLDQLLAAGISSDTLTALSLAPVVLVAWADGEIADQERKAILEASTGQGIASGSAGYELLENWLNQPPDQAALADAWKGYSQLVVQRLDHEQRSQFRDAVLKRARNVAKAAGGILGVRSISESERKVLDDLKAALPD